MNRLLGTFVLSAFALTACGGGASTGSSVPPSPAFNPAAAAQSAASSPNQAMSPDRKKHRKYVRSHFFIKIPKKKRGKHPVRGGHFIGAGARSVKITLNSVQGGATPPPGLLLSVTTNISGCTSGCTVNGPSAPPGVDNMTVTVYDGSNASSDAISTATKNFTITAGTANNLSVTLFGIVAGFTAVAAGGSRMPDGTAGTSIASASLDVEANDWAGDVITGTYANPFTIEMTGDGGATSLAVNGGTPASSVQTTASTDTFAFNCSGIAIDTATLGSPDVAGSSPFQPWFPTPLVCNGGGGGDQPNARPDRRSISILPPEPAPRPRSPRRKPAGDRRSCRPSRKATPARASQRSRQPITSRSRPRSSHRLLVGSCTVTVTGGGPSANNSEGVTVTYTTSGFGVNAPRKSEASPEASIAAYYNGARLHENRVSPHVR